MPRTPAERRRYARLTRVQQQLEHDFARQGERGMFKATYQDADGARIVIETCAPSMSTDELLARNAVTLRDSADDARLVELMVDGERVECYPYELGGGRLADEPANVCGASPCRCEGATQ